MEFCPDLAEFLSWWRYVRVREVRDSSVRRAELDCCNIVSHSTARNVQADPEIAVVNAVRLLSSSFDFRDVIENVASWA